jgi:membrane protease YdiL (CAAX protease family)
MITGMRCSSCGLVNFATVTECRRCGVSLVAAVTQETAPSGSLGTYEARPAFSPRSSGPAGADRPLQYGESADQSAASVIADYPPWGTLAAIGVWLFSLLALFLVPLLVVLGYAFLSGTMGVSVSKNPEAFFKSPAVALLLVASTILAELLIFMLLRAVVTGRGRRNFSDAIAWRWTGASPTAQLWTVLALATLVIGLELFASAAMPQNTETDFEKFVKTSREVALLVAFVAVFIAPFVEEAVYRGVLYPALARSTGMWPAVMVVSALFFLVHVPQYYGAWGGLAAILAVSVALTVLRAKTGSILPGFIVHTVFNLFGAFMMLAQPKHPAF